MKKSIFMIGCAVMLSLSMLFAGCGKDDNNDTPDPGTGGGGGGGGGSTVTNVVTVNNDSYDITSAMYYFGEEHGGIIINFVYSERTLSFVFDDKTSIPVGTFNIGDVNNGDCYAMLISENEILMSKSGSITISNNNGTYTVNAEGFAALMIREDYTFTCKYTGAINAYTPPTPPPSTDNVVTVNDDSYDITSAMYYVGEEYGGIIINFVSGEKSLSFVFDDKASIPVGTFNIGDFDNGDCYAMLSAPEGFLLSKGGTITISKTNDTYTVNAEGIAAPTDREEFNFTCKYTGAITQPTPPSTDSKITINNVDYPITLGVNSVITELGITMAAISLGNDDSDVFVGFAFYNQTSIPVGTFNLVNNPLLGAVAVVGDENGNEYKSLNGTLTISKNGNKYNIVSNGTAELTDYKETISFSCNYEGELIQYKNGMKFVPFKK